MIKKLKQLFRAFFTLSRSEQRAIVIILILTILVVVINLMLPAIIYRQKADFSDFEKNVEDFQQAQQSIFDSIEIERLQNRGELDFTLAQQKIKPFKFDPNDLPVELWKQLGLTSKQVKMIKNYEDKGGSFLQKEDLKRMYCISDAEYKVLEPYIAIKTPYKTLDASQLNKPGTGDSKSKKRKIVYSIVEINTADITELTSQLHLPEWLAKRVIKYRNLLGGYAVPEQLFEVYGFESNQMNKIREYLLINKALIRKLNLNKSSFKDLLKHPYISYEITQNIVNYRLENGDFKSINDLVDDEIISESLFIKLKPYLTVDEQ